MSSGTPYESNAGRNMSSAAGDAMGMDRIRRLGLSPRSQKLSRYYAFYRCCNYEARQVSWDGSMRMDPLSHEGIASGNPIPPGFYDAGQTTPLRFRKPTAPYNLTKVIVDRFTSLLFSQRRHPQLRVLGDMLTEDYARALADTARLWPAMIRARSMGGAIGTSIAGFQFANGRPMVEVHDARWCTPEWADRYSFKLASIEKRYQYPIEERDPETGAWTDVAYWYRRVIDMESDTVWKPIPVGGGDEPHWSNPDNIMSSVRHNLGFCPVVWAQNLPVEDDVDGDPDCHGVFDMIEAIDTLLSQADRGVIANCDPTTVIIGPDKLAEVAKGSMNAMKLTSGDMKYLEMTGSGPKAATELAEIFRNRALEVAQCVLENTQQGGARTATEIERMYASMISKADVLREQYGEHLVRPVVEMMLRAARAGTRPYKDEATGAIIRGGINLPPRIEKRGDKQFLIERKLGPRTENFVELQWPGYFEPPLADVDMATRAASSARTAGLIDAETAAKFIANYFAVEDVQAVLEKAKQEKQDDLNTGAGDFLEGMKGGGLGGNAEPAAPDPSEQLSTKSSLDITATDIGAIVTVNEARESVGLGPMDGEDGELTIAEFKAKRAGTIAAAAAADAGDTAPTDQNKKSTPGAFGKGAPDDE